MPPRNRTQLTARIVLVPHPDAAKHRKEAFRVLGEGFADLLIAQARAELAETLGVPPESIDHERAQLDDDVRDFMDGAVGRRNAA